MLETALVVVQGSTKSEARIIFDTASTLSFITSATAKRCGAKLLREEVSSLGRFKDSKRTTSVYKVYSFDVVLPDGSSRPLTAFAVPTICTPVALVPISTEHQQILSTVKLAEPLVESCRSVTIDILVGMDAYHTLVSGAQIRLAPELVLKSTVFGWMPSGFQRTENGPDGDSAHVILRTDITKSETFDVERFWALDEIGIKDDPGSADDEAALRFFNETIKFVDGRYMVKWPFKENHPDLPSNKHVALRRLKSLWSKMKDRPQVLENYDQIFRDQLRLGDQQDGHSIGAITH